MGPYFLHSNLFIRSFIYSEINTCGLPKFSEICFVFNILDPTLCKKWFYLKAIQKITPMDVSLLATIDQKAYLKKFMGLRPPSHPWDPPMPTCYDMAPDKLDIGAQCCFHKFDCRLFISKFSQFAFSLSLSLSVISTSLTQPCCKCCNLSVSVVFNVRFTTNEMCMNNTHIYVVRTSRNRMSTTSVCCHSVKLCTLATQAFQSQQSVALTRMRMCCQGQPEPTAHGITTIEIPHSTRFTFR